MSEGRLQQLSEGATTTSDAASRLTSAEEADVIAKGTAFAAAAAAAATAAAAAFENEKGSGKKERKRRPSLRPR